MKNLKRLLSGLLACALICGVMMFGTSTAAASDFYDVPGTASYAEAVAWCKEHGIMAGTSDTTFDPNGTLSRAMLATTLYRVAGSPAVGRSPSYTDAVPGSWYADALVWCADTGLMSGYGGGVFGVNDPVTREQMVTVLWRQQGSPAVQNTQTLPGVSAWASDAVKWAIFGQILELQKGQINPKDSALRSQVAVALYQTLKEDEPAEGTYPENNWNDWDNPSETTPKPTHTHAWATTWSNNDIYHWHNCIADGCTVTANADKDGYARHTWNDGRVIIEPTTEAEGVRTYTCTVCPATRTESIDKLPSFDPTPAPGSATLETTTYTVNGVDFTMVLVEAGTFTMGSSTTQSALSPRTVTLDQDYLMGETEVTEALWNAVMGNGGGSNSMPKTSVTWSSTFTFLDKLNQIAHDQGIIPDNLSFHLPSEAQWEFAAKGGNLSQGYTYSGSNNINDVAQTQENSGTSPVAVKQKSPNELGLYDMSGNAYEWVNETVSGGHVKKGGSNYHSFRSEPYLYTPEGRYIYSSTDWTIGFRICLY